MRLATTLLLSLHLFSTQAFAQLGGSLTPPTGAPTQTYRSLDQIDGRIPLQAGSPGVETLANGWTSTEGTTVAPQGFVISSPGSYFLTSNLTVTDGIAIFVTSSRVTLDLNGYLISTGAANSGSFPAVQIGSEILTQVEQVVVRNGSIKGEFSHGVRAESPIEFTSLTTFRTKPISLIVEKVMVEGATVAGIDAPLTGSRVVECYVRNDGTALGIRAGTVEDAFAETEEGVALSGGRVVNSEGIVRGTSDAISADVVVDSTGTAVDGIGINAGSEGSVEGSTGISELQDGILAMRVINSKGVSEGTALSANGIEADLIISSTGQAADGVGINAGEEGQVKNSRGTSQTNHGIFASSVVSSFGKTSDNSNNVSDGIHATGPVNSSEGHAVIGIGIYSQGTVSESKGISEHYIGISAQMVNGSDGRVLIGTTSIPNSTNQRRGIFGTSVDQSYGSVFGVGNGDLLFGIEGQIVTGSVGKSVHASGDPTADIKGDSVSTSIGIGSGYIQEY